MFRKLHESEAVDGLGNAAEVEKLPAVARALLERFSRLGRFLRLEGDFERF
jgi:hypothetical protein